MHLRCEVCGCAENWCFDKFGEVWTRCMNERCQSHQQTEFWPEEPVWPQGVTSVSERDDPDGPTGLDQVKAQQDSPADLPF